MKKSSLMLCVFVLSAFVFSQSLYSQAKYTGVKTCSACHRGEKGKNVFEKWQSSAHSKAFETLKSDKSKEIAKKMGISDPASSDKCLTCHVTNGGNGAGIKKEEGVTCESCHGAGSEYKAMNVMKDHDLAVKKGLIQGKNNPDLCKKCHNPKSPTYKPFDFAKKMAMIKH
ncbi:MAG: cytochrome c family protein [Bacteroidota bacterium]|nr:cytochrome c family protein [Bacteroidota bacterium]